MVGNRESLKLFERSSHVLSGLVGEMAQQQSVRWSEKRAQVVKGGRQQSRFGLKRLEVGRE